jgi:hypothetical protein
MSGPTHNRPIGPVSRRTAMRAAFLGLAGLGPSTPAAAIDRRPARGTVPRADACILIFLAGGPSHLDMWDMKPDAPAEIRGEFRPIATSAPDVHICEHMPRLARLMHHCALVRSVHHDVRISHGTAAYLALTGQSSPDRGEPIVGPSSEDHPAFGSAVGAIRPPISPTLPYVWLPHPTTELSHPPIPGMFAGWLGRSRDPFVLDGNPDDDDFHVPELMPSPGLTADRLRARRDLLVRLDHPGGTIDGFDGHRARAFDLLASPAVARAFRLDEEPVTVRDSYGRNRYGQGVLLARRLIESGVRVVCVAMSPSTNTRWDTHASGFASLRRTLLPELDSALAGLIADLVDRGRLGRTLVAVMGEFGREPRINREAGREHWPRCYSVLLAGGGIRGSYVHGASDRIGAEPTRDPIGPSDVLATLYHGLGIPCDLESRDVMGRPHRLVPGDGRPLLNLYE